jgi:formylglycine-generating enzyme required for sulfatase activity
MDIPQLAAEIAKFLAPFLPYLIMASEAAAKEAGKKFGEVAWNKAVTLWEKLKPKVEEKPLLKEATEKVARKPEDKRVVDNLEFELEEVFNEDVQFAEIINSIVITGDVINSQIAKGDGNTQQSAGDNSLQIGSVDKLYLLGEQYQQTPAEDIPDKELIHAYLRSLASECSRLPLGVVDPRFLENSGENSISLSSIYIDLDVQHSIDEQKVKKQEAELFLERERQNRLPVLEALNDSKLHRLVLLGDPGSGKTTCLHYITYALCLASQNDPSAQQLFPEEWKLSKHFPVRLVLRDVAAQHIPVDAQKGNADMIWNALQADLISRVGDEIAKTLFPKLQQFIIKNPCLVMLDGLDEVTESDGRRERLIEAIDRFCALLKKESCVLVTARPYAYTDPKWQLPNFKTLTLLPFDNEQIERFITRWYETMRESMKWDEATANDKAQSLHTATREKEYLFDIATRPLLLTLMTTLHTSWGKLPDDRADLYEETVRLLLDRWQRWREARDSQGNLVIDKSISIALSIDEINIRRALNQLAWTVHTRQGEDTQNRKNEPADIRQAEVESAFSPYLADTINSRVLVKYLETRAGLLLGRGNGVFAFPHRSFQEYLAACYINDLLDPATEYTNLIQKDPTWWREVFLLGIGKMSRGGLGTAIAALQTLLFHLPDSQKDRQVKDWQAFSLAGESITEMKLNANSSPYEKLIIPIRTALVQLIENNHLSPRERAEAGNVLAQLGDPRIGVIPFPHPQPLSQERERGVNLLFCEIPAGKFLMGSKESDKDSYKSEYPQFEYKIQNNFFMSRYLVTNAQFEAFVKAEDGYTNSKWWTEAGLNWRKDRREQNRYGGVFDLANHPVVGVSWYEATAFCKWLTVKLQEMSDEIQVWKEGKVESHKLESGKWEIRLPSEAEWEYAARGGVNFLYPWKSNEITANNANYSETNLNGTSTVGAFPAGENDFGLLDMSGNVWEWCRTEWQADYKEYLKNENNEIDGNKSRVLRGGSFDHNRYPLRCAFRNGYYPLNENNYVGFRLCVSSIAPL